VTFITLLMTPSLGKKRREYGRQNYTLTNSMNSFPIDIPALPLRQYQRQPQWSYKDENPSLFLNHLKEEGSLETWS
jgi:hypothetical protein